MEDHTASILRLKWGGIVCTRNFKPKEGSKMFLRNYLSDCVSHDKYNDSANNFKFPCFLYQNIFFLPYCYQNKKFYSFLFFNNEREVCGIMSACVCVCHNKFWTYLPVLIDTRHGHSDTEATIPCTFNFLSSLISYQNNDRWEFTRWERHWSSLMWVHQVFYSNRSLGYVTFVNVSYVYIGLLITKVDWLIGGCVRWSVIICR
jgi:hypothetical protein